MKASLLAICNTLVLVFLTFKFKTMATKQQRLDAALSRLNAATNDIAGDLRNLRNELASGTVSDESLNALDRHIGTLEAIGMDGGVMESGDISNVDPDRPERVVDGTPEGGIPPVIAAGDQTGIDGANTTGDTTNNDEGRV